MHIKPRELCSSAPPVECTTTTRIQCINDNASTCEQSPPVAYEPQPVTCDPQPICEPQPTEPTIAPECAQHHVKPCHKDRRDERGRCVLVEDCVDHCYPRETRPRLLPPVFPTKPKERKKRKKKGAKRSSEQDDTITGETGAQKDTDYALAPISGISPTKPHRLTFRTYRTTTKTPREISSFRKSINRELRSRTPSPRKKQPLQTGNIFFMRRPKSKAKIDWKKPPRFPVKQTATSKLRNEYWFADCGKFRVKAYRGDWANFPAELAQDYELYENYFKYRKDTNTRKKSSLVKKIVEGKINLQKPRIGKKIFQKRSPILPSTSKLKLRSPSRKSKKKAKVNLGYLQKRGAHFNLKKKPLIEVKQTMTTNLRNTNESEPCKKPDTPTYWHGSAEEIEDLKNKINQRKGQLRNYYKKKSEPGNTTASPKVKKSNKTDSMNNLIVISKPSTLDGKDPETKRSSRKSISREVSLEKKNKTPKGKQTEEIKECANPKRHRSVSVNKQVKAIKSPKATSKRRGVKTKKSTHPGLDKLYNATKWMLPPTIPIRHSLTSVMRQSSRNKPLRSFNGLSVKLKKTR